jgi:hypothetical protein
VELLRAEKKEEIASKKRVNTGQQLGELPENRFIFDY